MVLMRVWIYRLADKGKVGCTRALKRRLRQQHYGEPMIVTRDGEVLPGDERVEVLAVYDGIDDVTASARERAWALAYGYEPGIPYCLHWGNTQTREQKAEYARLRWSKR
jgi:hypothetical protein